MKLRNSSRSLVMVIVLTIVFVSTIVSASANNFNEKINPLEFGQKFGFTCSGDVQRFKDILKIDILYYHNKDKLMDEKFFNRVKKVYNELKNLNKDDFDISFGAGYGSDKIIMTTKLLEIKKIAESYFKERENHLKNIEIKKEKALALFNNIQKEKSKNKAIVKAYFAEWNKIWSKYEASTDDLLKFLENLPKYDRDFKKQHFNPKLIQKCEMLKKDLEKINEYPDSRSIKTGNKNLNKSYEDNKYLISEMLYDIERFCSNIEEGKLWVKRIEQIQNEEIQKEKQRKDYIASIKSGEKKPQNISDYAILLNASSSSKYLSTPPLNGPSKRNQYFFWTGTVAMKDGETYIVWDVKYNSMAAAANTHFGSYDLETINTGGFAFKNIKKQFGELLQNGHVKVVGRYTENNEIILVSGERRIIPVLSNCYVLGY